MKILKELSRKEFKAKFGSEDQCLDYLSAIKWSEKYSCRKCKNEQFSAGKKKYNRRCSRCGYDESPTSHTLFIGKDHIKVPRSFYKVVFRMKTYEYMAIAFIIENKGSDHSLEQFVVTIDELENILKIDFFPFL